MATLTMVTLQGSGNGHADNGYRVMAMSCTVTLQGNGNGSADCAYCCLPCLTCHQVAGEADR